jgi:mannose-1-phosphate guanylyltransferase
MTSVVRPSTALILCGGNARRLGAIGRNTSKCLLHVQGSPILFHQLDRYEEAGVSDVYLALGHLGSDVRAAVSRREDPMRYHFIDAVGTGTGGAILRALEAIPRDRSALWVSMGDIICRPPLETMWHEFVSRNARAVILGVQVLDPSEFGVLVYSADGWLHDFKEKSVKVGPAMVDAGFYLFVHEFLAEFQGRTELSLEYEVFPTARRVLVLEHQDFWWDIGTVGRLREARRTLSDSEFPCKSQRQ